MGSSSSEVQHSENEKQPDRDGGREQQRTETAWPVREEEKHVLPNPTLETPIINQNPVDRTVFGNRSKWKARSRYEEGR
jgi:hypothetical protein